MSDRKEESPHLPHDHTTEEDAGLFLNPFNKENTLGVLNSYGRKETYTSWNARKGQQFGIKTLDWRAVAGNEILKSWKRKKNPNSR